jgi:hypothetical protein
MSQTKVAAPFVENNANFRNIIINGDMNIAQRSTQVTGIGASAGYFTIDRFDMYFQNTAGRLTMSQETITDLPGFYKALKLDCTTADTSIAAAESAVLQYHVEGQHLQHLKKGTSSAEKTTLSFYVKGDQAATYTCELADKDNSRQNTQTFSVTTSWNRVVLVFDGDTTGTYGNDNAKSLSIQIHLQAGSNSTSGTFTSNTWAANTDANTVKSDQTQFFDSTDRELFITGFQYEVGDQATDFEYLPFDVQFNRCQRYLQNFGDSVNSSSTGTDDTAGGDRLFTGMRSASDNGYLICPLPLQTRLRSAPTVTSNNVNIRQDGTNISIGSFSAVHNFGCVLELVALGDANLTISNAGQLRFTGTGGYLRLDCEL